MMKCPYCQRPLRMKGLYCRACRRYVFSWVHLLVLFALGTILALALLELVFRVI